MSQIYTWSFSFTMSFGLPNKGLKIAHLNISSLMHKVQDLSLLMHNEKVHILALTETHLDNSVEDEVINIPGYSIFRHDRNKNGGGVAIYIHNNTFLSKSWMNWWTYMLKHFGCKFICHISSHYLLAAVIDRLILWLITLMTFAQCYRKFQNMTGNFTF